MTTRRAFLASLAASAVWPSASWAEAGSPAFLAAAREADGGYALFGLSERGADIFRIPLPDRGHAAAAHPSHPEAVAFARRPGNFALVIDCLRGRVAHRLTAPRGRHFYGHGVFIEGGALLVTTENEIETGRGLIGLWSRAEGYARVGEIASGGIGPHDLLALPGDLLAVANGGIRTHPDSGREKLNIDTMRPNLSYLTVSGGIAERVELAPDMRHASIRHLAAQDDLVAFAMQLQEPLAGVAVPLLGLHRRGAAPVLCQAGLADQLAMEGYAGSVAIEGGRVGITSPRGGRLQLFDLDGAHRQSFRRMDICGLATGPRGLVATDGLGGVLEVGERTLHPVTTAPRAWDNHLVRVPAI
ncbi:DUF1513 domain-containing protein [Maritimibacter sp. 55A14]|uniref:DUF1513 domain-containing protein n=1 Tax=Maritimibacter sp. 55A14 TaxID=2174844 RepID=UPI000D615956|nr:DUF1513 domain-containing protein [Maritimibacter sp. 55A14]PWE28797.1 DUF1513 domain-containing protein [Maritimibacter sp. 55A14]